MIKLYNTWRRAKDTFAKPRLKVYFGKWSKDPNLPVWRTGPPIYLCRRKNLLKNCYFLKTGVSIVTGTRKMKWGAQEYECQVYDTTYHKLPGNLRTGQYMWNRDIRKKLKKWHLSWVKPVMYLPMWLKFKIINLDVGWKTKWDDVRYEYPPQFSIIAFGLSLTFTLHCPVSKDYCHDDSYWESILTHLYLNKPRELKETIDECGIWRRVGDEGNTEYFSVRPEFIIQAKQEEYYAATSEIKARYIHRTIV